jgi:hypothetical protein
MGQPHAPSIAHINTTTGNLCTNGIIRTARPVLAPPWAVLRTANTDCLLFPLAGDQARKNAALGSLP